MGTSHLLARENQRPARTGVLPPRYRTVRLDQEYTVNQVKTGAFGRTLTEKKSHNFGTSLPEHLAEQAAEMLKSRYNLEFLGLKQIVKERELEDRLITRLQQFILELGYGFCFVG